MAVPGFDIGLGIDDAGIAAALRALIAAADDMTDVMDEIGSSLVASTHHRFETATGPDGTPWLPSKRAEAEGGQTLKKSGALFRSIDHRPSRDAVEVGVKQGEAAVYAAMNQFGGTIKPKKPGGKLRFKGPGGGWVAVDQVTIPARPYLGKDEDDDLEVLTIIQERMAEIIRGTGGGGR